MPPLTLANQVGGVILIALILYVVFGGADFGGGVWDLFATGPRAKRQRGLIADAIGPIWEANHVWVILVVVLLFVAFPKAFATVSIALHIPLTLMLIGIVLRGSAFVFRSYGPKDHQFRRIWGLVFSIASTVTPITLGMCVGALASGTLKLNAKTGIVQTDYISAWLAPFPIALGFFTLALFAQLAAVYLTLESDDPALQTDFRRRALLTGVLVGGLAWLCFSLAKTGAPLIYQGLSQRSWSLPFQLLTGSLALGALVLLWLRRYWWARVLVIAQTIAILVGWALAQFPYLVAPDITIANAAAPDSVLRPLMIALLAGLVVLTPALWFLFKLFKGEPPEPKQQA